MFQLMKPQETKTVPKPTKKAIEYKLTQSAHGFVIIFPIEPNTPKSKINFDLTSAGICVSVGDDQPAIAGCFLKNINTEKSSWEVTEKTVEITLTKETPENWPVFIHSPYQEKIDPHSYYLLSFFFEGTKRYTFAFDALMSAADGGHYHSILKVATILTTPTNFPIQPNDEKALYYWKKAGSMGDPQALFMVGCFHFSGTACEKDFKLAAKYFNESIEKGCDAPYYNLGILYLKGGNGVEQNHKLAYSNLIKAAEALSPDAMIQLALMRSDGIYVKKDLEISREWVKNAKELDSTIQIPEQLFENDKTLASAILKESEKKNETKKTEVESDVGSDIESDDEENEMEEQPTRFKWLFTFSSLAVVTGLSLLSFEKNNNDEEL
ncbi:sel1l adaptor subunit of erad e3 ubiquitin ligase [Anaeramoeba flamelloides]|uniref:Sel1l adaptor subunit of erad e3 ubiquitin ligase n=1 Tax=Anaeramoeba flamelloides TaxID=1746091 RepID=A0AAV7YCI5_9EUKA|nr:sel1l adaptor subunit of erad e3 ubiquitin ligase [Anaeramoeba flamelloides]